MIKHVCKKLIKVRALQWTGLNFEEMFAFTGHRFKTIVDAKFTAGVFDELHNEWIPLQSYDYVIEGVQGEYYPCNQEVFNATYVENMSVFLVLIDDTHVGLDPYVFATADEAVKFAKHTADEYSDDWGVREQEIEGCIYFANYSPDSTVRVMEMHL